MTSLVDPVADAFFNVKRRERKGPLSDFNVRDYYDLEADDNSSDSDNPKKKSLKKV